MAHHFFVVDYATGTPRELFRSTLPGRDFSDGCIERAKRDGTWSSEEADIRPVLNLWMEGDFDPEEDGVSEEEAQALLEQWRATAWPGRP